MKFKKSHLYKQKKNYITNYEWKTKVYLEDFISNLLFGWNLKIDADIVNQI